MWSSHYSIDSLSACRLVGGSSRRLFLRHRGTRAWDWPVGFAVVPRRPEIMPYLGLRVCASRIAWTNKSEYRTHAPLHQPSVSRRDMVGLERGTRNVRRCGRPGDRVHHFSTILRSAGGRTSNGSARAAHAAITDDYDSRYVGIDIGCRGLCSARDAVQMTGDSASQRFWSVVGQPNGIGPNDRS